MESPVAFALRWYNFPACEETSSQKHQAEETNWVFGVGGDRRVPAAPLFPAGLREVVDIARGAGMIPPGSWHSLF